MKRLSWKYVAGLIDGEGCIDFASGRRWDKELYITPRIRVTLTTPGFEVIELLLNNFGGYVESREGKDNNWPSKTWVLVGRRCRRVLQNIKNHLIIKRGQAEFMIWYIDELLGKHLTDEIRLAAYNEMKQRKRDPHRLSVPTLLRDAIVETRKA